MSRVVSNYFFGRFAYDLMSFLPFGLLMLIDKQYKILWITKSLRIRELTHYISYKFICPIYINYIEMRQRQQYEDKNVNESMDEDLTFLNQKISGKGIIRVFVVILRVLFFVYFAGIYLFILFDLMHELGYANLEHLFDKNFAEMKLILSPDEYQRFVARRFRA